MYESVFLYLVSSCKLYLVFRCFQLLLIILWVLFHSINKVKQSKDILQKCIYRLKTKLVTFFVGDSN
jgi:hypothetical protein